jgi:hypothetical protein
MLKSLLLVAAFPLLAATPTQKTSVASQTERAWSAAVKGRGSKGSCAKSIGLERARALARYCRFQSGATRPPCNSGNSCDLITGHIDSSLGGTGKLDPAVLPGRRDMTPAQWRSVARLKAL